MLASHAQTILHSWILKMDKVRRIVVFQSGLTKAHEDSRIVGQVLSSDSRLRRVIIRYMNEI